MASTPSASDAKSLPRPGVRAVVSVLLIIHLIAVLLGPLAMPPQASELVAACAGVFQPYVEGMSLANGYRFFAPEPGPSHIVRYELTFDDGSTREGFFPSREANKPRLLYHRYFMMSEFLNTLENSGAPRERLDKYIHSFAQHLTHAEGAKSVRLYLRRHWVPRMEEVRAGRRLSDPVLYVEHPLGTFERDKT